MPMPTTKASAMVKASTCPIEADFRGARNVGERTGEQQLQRPRRDGETERAADDCQHDRLGEQLTREAAAARAERGARGELFHARAGADEHQVGEVDAANQQHERDAAPQQIERPAHFAHQIGLRERTRAS